jgi:DNA-binding MarR family transcriptional regulator
MDGELTNRNAPFEALSIENSTDSQCAEDFLTSPRASHARSGNGEHLTMTIKSVEQRVGVSQQANNALARGDPLDLSARDLGVFLACYWEDGTQTVDGLAAKLNVSRPRIIRALDHLATFDLVRHGIDSQDRCNMSVQRTTAGGKFLRNITNLRTDNGAT